MKDSWRASGPVSHEAKKENTATPIRACGPVLVFIWEFPNKWEVPPNHPKLDQFSLKTYGFGDPPHGLKAPDRQT